MGYVIIVGVGELHGLDGTDGMGIYQIGLVRFCMILGTDIRYIYTLKLVNNK